MAYWYTILLCAFCIGVANPFSIDFPCKENLSCEDYIEIQNRLRSVDIDSLLQTLHCLGRGYTTYEDIYARCTKGLKQGLIDPENGRFPQRLFEKIGAGSDCCIVCCVPYDDRRTQLGDSISDALKQTGFNGYFLYQRGGFPNPTGREIQYAGVPYCFKIFMMLEAYKLGFTKVLWIDSAALPLRDPTPLFDWIDQTGSLLMSWHHPDIRRYIFQQTQQILEMLTGVNVLSARYIWTTVFGLKMDSDSAQSLIRQYYDMVRLGTPFLSCFPEEFVLTAILNQPEFASWRIFPYSIASWFHGGNEGYFFYLREH